jgi:hypothetical protein
MAGFGRGAVGSHVGLFRNFAPVVRWTILKSHKLPNKKS